MNNPQIVVAVILDSAVGLHQGGQVSAPVFRRISQQVLEYLHVPHDLPLAPQHQLLLAQSKMKDKDLEEGTPDHPGEPLETAEVNGGSSELGESSECGAERLARDCRERRTCCAGGDAGAEFAGQRPPGRKPGAPGSRQTRGRCSQTKLPPQEPSFSTSSKAESKCRRS